MAGVLGNADPGAVFQTAILWAICWVRIWSMNASSVSSNTASIPSDCARITRSDSAPTASAMRRRMLGPRLAADELVAEAVDIDDLDRSGIGQGPAYGMQDAAQIVARFLFPPPDCHFQLAPRKDMLWLP